MHLVIDLVELINVIGPYNFLLQHRGLINYPAVQRQHLVKRQSVTCRIESANVRQQKARRITDASIGIGSPFENFIADSEFPTIIGGCDPQAQNIRPEVVHSLFGGNDIAQGLGHFASLAVYRKSVSQNGFVGSFAVSAYRCK